MIHWKERKVQLSRCVLPGDVRKRAAGPVAVGLARQLELGACARLPVFRRDGGRLVCWGEADLVAAHLLLQHTECIARVFESSDTEAEIVKLGIELDSNTTTEETRRMLVAKVAAMKEELLASPELQTHKRAGRRRSAYSSAVQSVSRLTGVEERRIRRLCRELAGDKLTEQPEPVIPKGQLKTWGMESAIDPTWLEQVGRIQFLTIYATDYAAKALRFVRMIREENLPYPAELLSGIETQMERAHDTLKRSLPVCVCPHCKVVSGIQESCVPCRACGWVNRERAEGAPARLHDEIDRAVVQNGEIVRLVDLI